ncbi:MAG TPA: hypothetical protein VMT46_17855 [Anaerolineaceae bacterium]|nr:hypothetical protein [Anaerolineaceae bacterium]
MAWTLFARALTIRAKLPVPRGARSIAKPTSLKEASLQWSWTCAPGPGT